MPEVEGGRALCAQLAEHWIGYFQMIAGGYAIPSRFDLDDCVQECCLELTLLMQETDPTDPDFEPLLKTRVFRRLIDLRRSQRASKRDVRTTVPLDSDAALDFSEPSAVVEARELEALVLSKLTPNQSLVWNELVSPSRRLGQCFDSHRSTKLRELSSVPVSVYAEVTGLSVRQVRHAMTRIRAVASQIFTTEGLPCLC